MRKLITAFAALGLIAALGFAGPTFAGNKNHGSSTIDPCGEDGTITTSPTTLWPPNHKDVTISFRYEDPTNDNVTLEITAKPHSEAVDGEEINGTGNTPYATDSTGGVNMDDDGDVTVDGTARAERSGHKNEEVGGREYRYEYIADADGGSDGCMSDPEDDEDDIVVFVPHDCRGGSKSGACHT